MRDFEALRLLALQAVIIGDEDSEIRKICRWYSTTYHTPLDKVHELPLDFVLQNFYEDKFEDMDKIDLRTSVELALETPAQRTERVKKEQMGWEKEDVEEAEFLKQIAEEAKVNPVKNAADSMAAMTDQLRKQFPKSEPIFKEAPETSLPVDEKLPEISMKFMTDKELEEFGEWDLLGDPKKQS